MNRIDKLLPILFGGALGAAESLGRKLNSGKNSDAKDRRGITETERKHRKVRKNKRKEQKKSRRRNRR